MRDPRGIFVAALALVLACGQAEPVAAQQFPGASSRLDDYIDPSLLDEIRQEDFIAALRQKYRLP
jgi:hypothetical protein